MELGAVDSIRTNERKGNRNVWAVVPLKSPDTAKSRLSLALDASARRRLFYAMAQHVIRTLVQTPGIAGVAVVTASPEVAAFSRRLRARVIREEFDAGTAQACRSAVEHLSGCADRLLMISGDLPLLSAHALAALVDLREPVPLVAIVPDRRRVGTNALLCTPPGVIPICFGPDSFRLHIAAALEHGAELRIVESDAMALDIDEIEDLQELRRWIRAEPTAVPAEVQDALRLAEEVPAQ